jgi:hypothetical protein
MRLSRVEADFLVRHSIPDAWVFDAKGMPRSIYRELMRASGHILATGVTPCRAAGHRLRTRAGHCVVCKPVNLLFLLRYHIPMDVYVARSFDLELAKIGVADDAAERIRSLNKEGYAGGYDWELYDSIHCRNAARVEGAVAVQFRESQRPIHWIKHGLPATAIEIFDEPPDVLMDALIDADRSVNR